MSKNKQYDPSKLAIVPIQSVETNGWNPKNSETKEYAQVVRSLELYGFRQPLLVRDHPTEPKMYQILDGEQRFTAATELGFNEVPIYNLGNVTDEEAKAATIWMEIQVPFNEVDLSHLVVELDNLDIALPYTEAEIADFKSMAEFDFGQYDTGEDDNEEHLEARTFKVVLGEEAYRIVTKAIEKIKEDNDCSEARALELMAADYLAGV